LISLSEIADALRWLWVGSALVWLAYAWLYRIEYRRVLLGVLVLLVLDVGVHWIADVAERPDSNIHSDFSLYSVMMLAAAGAGLTAACIYARWRGLRLATVLEAAVVCAVAGGIAGRAYQVLTHWDYYAENVDYITDLSQGGFGMSGALAAGLLALALFAFLTHNSFWQLADAAAIGLAIAQCIGWYGAYLTHAHYGIPLDAATQDGWFAPFAQAMRGFGYVFVQDLPDAYNLVALRIPVQLLTSIFFLGLFLALALIAVRGAARPQARRYAQDGILFLIYWIAAASAAFLFSFWRGDETLWWNGLRLDQWLDLVLLVVGIGLVVWRRGKVRSGNHGTEKRILQHA
jgi:phosphatidylglycerol---prolipoprotein diacylglyceryl transferase